MQTIIEISNGVPRHPGRRMASPVNLRIQEGQQVAIVGDNASGKSRLVDIITEKYPLLLNEVHFDFTPSPLRMVSENIRYITFRDSYGEQDGTYYLQQRWNQHDIAEDTPTAGLLLEQARRQAEESMGHGLNQQEREVFKQRHAQFCQHLHEIFHLDSLLDKYIISLSSGELRKFQLTRTLLSSPRVLILDNPFIGLDADAREQLATLLGTLVRDTSLLVILVLSQAERIPSFITHIIPVTGMQVQPMQTREQFLASLCADSRPTLPQETLDWLRSLPVKHPEEMPFYAQGNGEILRFEDVSIRYGTRTILHRLHWTVKEGERWALRGSNGSGKSTLLSLVCADNPQSYACRIHLFGHRRGTGESIWDIKRHIGYVSPEMHRAYLKDLPAMDIVCSGLSDSVGLYCRPRPAERKQCLEWMRVFGIEHLAERTFLSLSSGEQRLCLLARAFVKDPELLILDEPLHGLDPSNCALVRQIIECFCQRPHKTLVMVTHFPEELPTCITHTLELTKPKDTI